MRLLSIAVPLAGLAVLYPLRLWLLTVWPASAVDTTVGITLLCGVLGVSWAIFRVIEGQDRALRGQHKELHRRYELERGLRAQLEGLHEAALVIASTRTPAETLQRLVDLSRDVIGARYAALGVLGREGAITDFYTAGISVEERARLGPPPQGHGLLGVLLTEGSTLRLPNLARDPRRVGFPPGHPPMTSLLGVPVAHGGTVVGTIYLADKVGAAEFPAEDERLLALLARHAAAVIQHARLAEQVRHSAVAGERARIGRDLHDGMIQALYAVNLELEDAIEDVEAHPGAVRKRLDLVIDRLGAVINDVRRSILGLQPEHTAVLPLPTTLAGILADARAQTPLETELHVEGDVAAVSDELAADLLQIAREAVTTVMRHAQASRLCIRLEAREGAIHLRISDNGRGFDEATTPREGLRSLRAQAEALGGRLGLHAIAGAGTTVAVWAPLRRVEQEKAHA
ncbi:MAG: hypothetical protein NVSMB65_05720 [Chloroflexota bacterium]